MTNKLENKNYYIQIADWMLDFKLPTNELLCYAIIFGYCQTGENCYYGSTETMAELLGLGRDKKGHASEYMKSLVKKGLLKKEEIKKAGKQKMCKYYALTNWKGRVDEQNVDYITIQPWMFNQLGLRNNSLLIYARIQNLSRSNSVYFYNDEDLAFWASCEKRKIRGYIKELVKKKTIQEKELGDNECYIATANNEININNPKNGTPIPKMEHLTPKSSKNGTLIPKNGTNNLSYTLNLDNLIYVVSNSQVSSGFDVERFQCTENIQKRINIICEAEGIEKGLSTAKDILMLIVNTLDNWGEINIKKINNMSENQYYKIFTAAEKLYYDNSSNETKYKLISNKVKQLLNSRRNNCS